VYRLGDRVDVQVVRVDMERRQIDLGLVEIPESVWSEERSRGPRHSKARPKQEERRSSKRRRQRPGRRERRKIKPGGRRR
jgi:ribosomal protein S1